MGNSNAYEKPAVTDRSLIDAVSRRWSPRAFDPGRPVGPETTATLLDAARWAPSSYNDQPWRYLVFDRSEPAARVRAEDCLNEGNSWARDAGLLLITMAAKISGTTGDPNRFALHDTGMANMCLVLQATQLGLHSHQMGGYDRDRARAEFAIPDEFELASMIAIGYIADPDALSDEVRARESQPRIRRRIAEFAFSNAWGNAIE